MCVCVYVRLCVSMYVYVCMHVYVHVCVYVIRIARIVYMKIYFAITVLLNSIETGKCYITNLLVTHQLL